MQIPPRGDALVRVPLEPAVELEFVHPHEAVDDVEADELDQRLPQRSPALDQLARVPPHQVADSVDACKASNSRTASGSRGRGRASSQPANTVSSAVAAGIIS